MYAKWCTMSNLAVPISRLYDFMDWILCSDDCWHVQTWQMLCGLKTILTDMNILNSYRHIRPKKVKYPIPKIPDDSGKKSGTDWVLPKIIGSGRVSGTRQALAKRWYCILLLESPCSSVRYRKRSHRISQWIYDANIITNVRCDHHHDDYHHHLCTMRSSSWHRSS